MCQGEACLGFFLLSVVFGFSVLIFFLLKGRNLFLKKNFTTTADQVWETVAERAKQLHLSKTNMLYGIWQDATATMLNLVIKNSQNQIIGTVAIPAASRKRTITIGNETFYIEFPMTLNRTAVLYASNGKDILAKYERTNMFGQHEFNIPGYGLIKSERPSLSLKRIFDYKIHEKTIGTIQQISSSRELGGIALFPEDISLVIKIFMLST